MSPSRLFHRRFTKAGAAPGHFDAHIGGQQPRIHVISYNADSIEERDAKSQSDILEIYHADRDAGRVTWVDIQGLGDIDLLGALDDIFGLHPLALADAVNVGQRPKIDDYDDTIYAAVRMVTVDEEVHWEQVSVFLGESFVITVQERHGDCLDPLRERLRKGKAVFRPSGPDYLFVMVIDAIVDAYYPVLETYGDHLEALELRVIEGEDDVLPDIYRAKRELLTFRRATWPLRDALSQALRDRPSRLHEKSLPYLRDVADHVMQVVDVTETYRELAASFIDVYLSSVANKTNDIMRVLTILATIFIPLTFLSGVYGMNFDSDKSHPLNLPELHWHYGYLFFWAICVAIAIAMLIMFRRLGWLGSIRKKH